MSWRMKSERNWGRLGMKSNWTTTTIDDVCSLVTDGAHNSPKSVEKGYYMASVKDFTEYGFDFSNCRQISEEDYEKLRKQGCVPQKDDVLVGKDGARYFEDIIIYRQDEQPALLSSIAILRANCKKIMPEFLYYTLKTPAIKKDVRDNYGSGSAIPRVVLKDFKRMPFSYPDIDEQRKITAVCSVIDAKIQVNNAINKNLYEQMLSIFNNARRTSAWNKHKLGDVLIFFDNLRKPLSSIQREKMAHIYPYYGAASIVDYVEDYLFDGTYILISEDGANVIDSFGHPLTQYTYGKFWVNNHAHIVNGSNGYSEALVYAMLGTLNMQSIVTGAAQPKINQANLRNFEAVLPESEEAQVLSKLLNPMLQQMLHHDQENEKLSELRDILLPQLMSGALDVSAIDL